jgi:small-conductance mechanosensitive channel
MAIPDFAFSLTPMFATAAKVVIIVAMALVLNIVQKRLVARAVRAMWEHGADIDVRAEMITAVIVKVATVIVWIISLAMVLGVLGVDTAPLLATLGVASLGLGFATQDVIRDYLQGFFIFMEDWYRVGDWVVIAGMEGSVELITPRRTVLRETNGTMHIIPNGKIPHASNQTRDWARINLIVTVAYKEDIDHVYQVINKTCQDMKNDPEYGQNMTTIPAAMRVSDLGDHGVDICIRGDTKPGEQWGLTGELRKRIKKKFDEESIEIPWPHTKVYFGDGWKGPQDVEYS